MTTSNSGDNDIVRSAQWIALVRRCRSVKPSRTIDLTDYECRLLDEATVGRGTKFELNGATRLLQDVGIQGVSLEQHPPTHGRGVVQFRMPEKVEPTDEALAAWDDQVDPLVREHWLAMDKAIRGPKPPRLTAEDGWIAGFNAGIGALPWKDMHDWAALTAQAYARRDPAYPPSTMPVKLTPSQLVRARHPDAMINARSKLIGEAFTLAALYRDGRLPELHLYDEVMDVIHASDAYEAQANKTRTADDLTPEQQRAWWTARVDHLPEHPKPDYILMQSADPAKAPWFDARGKLHDTKTSADMANLEYQQESMFTARYPKHTPPIIAREPWWTGRAPTWAVFATGAVCMFALLAVAGLLR